LRQHRDDGLAMYFDKTYRWQGTMTPWSLSARGTSSRTTRTASDGPSPEASQRCEQEPFQGTPVPPCVIDPHLLLVDVPKGVTPGDKLTVGTPDGGKVLVTVPDGAWDGAVLEFRLPDTWPDCAVSPKMATQAQAPPAPPANSPATPAFSRDMAQPVAQELAPTSDEGVSKASDQAIEPASSGEAAKPAVPWGGALCSSLQRCFAG